MSELQVKGIIGTCVTVFTYLIGCINILVIVVAILMILDYISGLGAAFVRQDLSSRKSLIGVFKKLGYLTILLLAFLLDLSIIYLVDTVGYTFPSQGIFGIITSVWLIGSEGLSVLENLDEIGVKIPKKLSQAFGKMSKEGDGEA